jgi:hypothetical protein
MLPTTESTKSTKSKTPMLNLSTKFSNPATEDKATTTIATEDGQTQDPTTATTTPATTATTATTAATATTPLLQTTEAALKAAEAHSPAQTLQTDNETRKSPVSTAKSKDITKTTAANESGTTSHASPEAENHTGQDQK